jgi:hypothetical protein
VTILKLLVLTMAPVSSSNAFKYDVPVAKPDWSITDSRPLLRTTSTLAARRILEGMEQAWELKESVLMFFSQGGTLPAR